ncbi:hypothetical protein A3C37_03235 [Candidatus Peribacteria bacterium RIFCSPHIGHO2_02_FULL_53_20]|nr:MAG: hypothetical protein A3C37_03235 [Candidatus Peribacteria bacterium RIFCSPHIGHO2_02_FULL_53_20]OGJ67414.1 MAG: hypothetical protein A3B61_00595 [Candidatus Peribacteria bacterium RIFCSPLOWO2_01_FULL_53_10]OGJ72608.1 MAG: hypothetical protein A3G69_01670 [Candidatus Peribacteria bacterium RIFCSPLOWO2_12_FULL_53_10]
MHMSPRLCWVSGERTPEKVYITRVFCYGSWEEWKDMWRSFPESSIEDAVHSPLKGSWTPQGKAFAETLFDIPLPDNAILSYLPATNDAHRDLA